MSEAFIEKLSQAYRSADLEEKSTLRQAARYMNFQKSPSEDQSAVRDCDDLTGGYAQTDHFDCRESRILVNRLGLGTASDVPGTVYWFQRADFFLPNRSEIDALVTQMSILRTPNARVQQFYAKWTDYATDEKMIWISEQGAEPPDKPLDHAVIFGLGLYHWRTTLPDDPILMLKFETGSRRKPSWIDAGLTFYFDVCPDIPTHGYTRCLMTGQRRFKEWIARKDGLTITDVKILRLARLAKPHQPPADFWQALKEEVEQARGP